MLGKKIKQLREKKGLLQRQVAAALELDTAFLSKIENNEKPLSRARLQSLAKVLEVPVEELEILWLADKVYSLLKKEQLAQKVILKASDALNEEPV